MPSIGKQVQAALGRLVAKLPPLTGSARLGPGELARRDVPADLDEAIDAAARRIAARRLVARRIAVRWIGARPRAAVPGDFLAAVTDPPPSAFWGSLAIADRTAWRAGASPCVLPAGTVLCAEGAPATEVFVLAAGWCKVYATDAGGGEVVLALRGPGDILGEASAVQGARRSATVLALTRVHALSMSAGTLRELLRDRPAAVIAIRKVTEERVVEVAWRMSSLATTTGPQRLARLLLNLADRYPAAQRPSHVPLALREPDLASWAGTSRACVTRTLATWRSGGVIGAGAERLSVTDIHALRAIAGSGPRTSPGLSAPAATRVVTAARPGESFEANAWASFGRQHAKLLQHLERLKHA